MTRVSVLARRAAPLVIVAAAGCAPTPPQPPSVDSNPIVARCFVGAWGGDAWIRTAARIPSFTVELRERGRSLWQATSVSGQLEVPLAKHAVGATPVELVVRAGTTPGGRSGSVEGGAPAGGLPGSIVPKPGDPPEIDLAASQVGPGFRIPWECIHGDGCVPTQCPSFGPTPKP